MTGNRPVSLIAAWCFCCILWPPQLVAETGKAASTEPPESARILRQNIFMQSNTVNRSGESGVNPDLTALMAKFQLRTAAAKPMSNLTSPGNDSRTVSLGDFSKRFLTRGVQTPAAGGDRSGPPKLEVRRTNEASADVAKRYRTRMQEVAGGDDEYGVQYEIFVYRNYNGIAPPSTTQVQLYVLPLRLQSARTEQQDGFSAQVALTQVWQDSRLSFSHPNVTEVFVYTQFMNKLWRPPVQFYSTGPVTGVTALIGATDELR